MYSRYAKTSIWDHKQCPLNGGEFYCVLYRECPLSEVHFTDWQFNFYWQV